MVFKFLRRFLKDAEDEQVSLQQKFIHFRRLLEGNNLALETMADMEEKLSGDFLFDTGYLYSQVEQLGSDVSRMVQELNVLTQDRYRELAPICQNILKTIQQELAQSPPSRIPPISCPYRR